MSKTIEQLRAEASQIEEATRQGENTQIRVGGLFQDIIDFIGQIPVTETVLGPLLTALNNSELINPGDGQTLTFSLMKEGWTFSDALTQLQIKLGQISSTVTSNYEAFIQVKDQLQREVDDTDQRVRSYKTEYDQSQIEYATWKSQTDTSISQYAVAIDKVTGDIVSISGRVDTAFDQLDFVTNDLEAADKAIGKIFDLTGMELSDEPSASWLYKNKDGIYGAAATFDSEGNIKQYSKLSVTINGIESKAENALGQVSTIKQTVDTIQAEVGTSQREIDTLNDYINGTEGNPGLLSRLGIAENKITADEAELSRHASTLVVHDNAIAAVSAKFNPDGSLANTSGLVVTSDFTELFTEAYNTSGGPATQVSKIRTDLDGVTSEVRNLDGRYTVLKSTVDGIHGEVYDPNTGIGHLNARANQMSFDIETLNGKTANMGIYVQKDDNGFITNANIKADKINFDYAFDWVVTSGEKVVFRLDNNGNLTVAGTISGIIQDSVTVRKGTASRYFEINADDRSGRATVSGYDSGEEVIKLGWTYSDPHPVLSMDNDGTILLYDNQGSLGGRETAMSASNGISTGLAGMMWSMFVNESGIVINMLYNGARFPTYQEATTIYNQSGNPVVYMDDDHYLKVRDRNG